MGGTSRTDKETDGDSAGVLDRMLPRTWESREWLEQTQLGQGNVSGTASCIGSGLDGCRG